MSIHHILSFLFLLFFEIHSFSMMEYPEDNMSNLTHQGGVRKLPRYLCKKSQNMTWSMPINYDKEIEPWIYQEAKNGTFPFYYHYEFRLYDIQEVNDFEHTLKLDMGLNIKWWEPRIDINFTSPLSTEAREEFFPIPLSYMKVLWTPDVEVYGMNAYQSPKVFNDRMASLSINQEGVLIYSNRPIITLSCHMSFEKYPFDSHQCIFRAGSFAYHNEIVSCTSSQEYPDDSFQRSLQYVVKLRDLPFQYQSWTSPKHVWETCGFSIELKRTKTQMMFQVFLPSTALVIISWFSFIINPSVVPGRMGMLLTVFLVLINIFIGVKNSSPISNGLNSVDVFLVVSIGQVFLVLIEYALVLIQSGPYIETICNLWRSTIYPQIDENISLSNRRSPEVIEERDHLSQKSKFSSGWNKLDMFSLILFPILFIAFLITYSQIFIE